MTDTSSGVIPPNSPLSRIKNLVPVSKEVEDAIVKRFSHHRWYKHYLRAQAERREELEKIVLF